MVNIEVYGNKPLQFISNTDLETRPLIRPVLRPVISNHFLTTCLSNICGIFVPSYLCSEIFHRLVPSHQWQCCIVLAYRKLKLQSQNNEVLKQNRFKTHG